MILLRRLSWAVAAALLLSPPAGRAQVSEYPLLEPGDMAPDFALTGATRAGPLEEPLRLSEFRGKTVVLAFFFQARSGG